MSETPAESVAAPRPQDPEVIEPTMVEIVDDEIIQIDSEGVEWVGDLVNDAVDAEDLSEDIVDAEVVADDDAADSTSDTIPATETTVISSALAPRLTLDDAEPEARAVIGLEAVEAASQQPTTSFPPNLDLPDTDAEYPSAATLPEPPAADADSYVRPTFGEPAQPAYEQAAYSQPNYTQPTVPQPNYGAPAQPSTPPTYAPQPQQTPYPPQPAAPYAQQQYAEPQQPYAQQNPYAQQPAYGLAPQYAPQASSLSSTDEQTWATAAHWSALLAGFFGIGFLGPLLILLIQGPKSARVRANAVESLNFEITFIISMLASVLLMLVVIGFATIFIFPLLWLILRIVASVQTANGQDYRYPLNIRLVK